MTLSSPLRELSPAAVDAMMRAGSIVLIDVREPQEYLAERIRGALLFPLSTFDPRALPRPAGCAVVFHCGSGKRSALAVARCLEQGITHTSHMAGGVQAWKAAGLQTIAPDAASGAGGDRR
ncbi:MAG: rhodanese-like domain-containing protein [Stellaceae bacterium]